MTTATLPPMPAWATDRDDVDYNHPGDGFTQFTGRLGEASAMDWNSHKNPPIELQIIAVGLVAEFEPPARWIELHGSNGPALCLTPAQARALSAELIMAAAEMESLSGESAR